MCGKEKLIIQCRWIGYFGVLIALFSMHGVNLVALLSYNLGNVYMLIPNMNNQTPSHLMKAQSLFSSAEQMNESFVRLPYMRGWAWFQQGEFERAVNSWKAFPDADYWLTMQGKIALDKGQTIAALEFLEIATFLGPNSSSAYYYGGIALFRMARYDEALQWFYTALELDNYDKRFAQNRDVGDIWWPASPENLTYGSSSAMTHIYISAIHCRLRQWDAMITAAQSAVNTDPKLPLGYLQLGTAYFMHGELTGDLEDYRFAEEAFASVENIMPDSVFSYYMYQARVYWRLEDIPNASTAYAKVARASRFADNHREVRQFFVETAQTEALVSLYADILMQTPRKPQHSYIWLVASEAYLVAGNSQEACELFEIGMSLCGDETCGFSGTSYVLAESPLVSACR